MNKKIIITGAGGRFGKEIRKIKTNYKIFYPSRKQLDITSVKSIKSFLKKKRPKILIHMAGLSRPMVQHDKNISKSSSGEEIALPDDILILEKKIESLLSF